MLTPHGWMEIAELRCGGRETRRVADILRRCYPQEAWTAPDVVGFSDRPGNVVKTLTLGDDEMIVGTLMYRVGDDDVQVARVAVDPRFRRCRIGAFALRSLTGPTSAVKRGVYQIRVHEENDAAIAFLRRCGFDATGVEREHFRDDKDAYVFSLFKEAPIRNYAPLPLTGR